MIALALTMLLCALVPAWLFVVNLKLYQPPPGVDGRELPAVSILIPARNEAHGIAAALEAALRTRGVAFEVVVMDDGSTDGTDAVVLEVAAQDSRVRLERAPALPVGWNGKQHACWALAQGAQYPVLCFVDADVRLAPNCVARMTGFLMSGNNGLVSGFPQQVTGTWMEWMLLPLIHFVLLGFLPLGRMRASTNPGFAAGCGQFLLADAASYFACGGHSGIPLTMHDGLRLPRLFREYGRRTDLADITNLATCRMYTTATQVWNGLAKNAGEGLGAPGRIVPITVLLLLGQVLPFAFLTLLLASVVYFLMNVFGHRMYILGVSPTDELILTATLIATAVNWLVRALAARRFRQDWRGAFLHPLGILLLLGVQWYALLRKLSGRAVSWKDRAYVKPEA